MKIIIIKFLKQYFHADEKNDFMERGFFLTTLADREISPENRNDETKSVNKTKKTSQKVINKEFAFSNLKLTKTESLEKKKMKTSNNAEGIINKGFLMKSFNEFLTRRKLFFVI